MKIGLALAVVAALIVALLAGFSRHFVWEREIDTQLIWSAKEAYFFVARQREGWSGNLIQLLWEGGRTQVGLAAKRSDRKRWLEVTRITASDAQTVVVPNSTAFPIGVFDNHVYASREQSLMKWVGHDFVHATATEQQRFRRERKASGEYRDVDGWSVEINIVRGAPGESSYPLVLDGVTVNVRVTQRPERRTAIVQYPNGSETTLLDLRNEPTQESFASYKAAFSDSVPKSP